MDDGVTMLDTICRNPHTTHRPLKRPIALAARDGGVAMQKPLAFDGGVRKVEFWAALFNYQFGNTDSSD